jgi:hypothetical protein
MRRDVFLALALSCALVAVPAWAADNLDLARRLVRHTGGVSVILRNFEAGLTTTSAAPDIFSQSFDTAMSDNQSAIVAADDQLARVYAALYSNQQLSAEVGFYESPEGQSIVTRNRAPSGAVVWPDPSSLSLSTAESTALTKFNAAVQNRAAVAAKNPKAMDQILSAEAGAVIKVRTAAFANYCKIRDCKAEGVKLQPQ